MGTKIATHFLYSNGVFSFRHILLSHFFYYSTFPTTTTTTTIPSSEEPNSLSSLTNWLVGSLGFSEKQALSTSTKLTKLRQSKGAKQVCNPNLLRNADLLVSFFHKKGLQKSQIGNVVYSAPQILTCRIERNLEPKMKLFQDLGFSVSDFARLISSKPQLLAVRFDSTIRPVVEELRAIMGSNENMVRAIKGFRLNSLQLMTSRVVFSVSALLAKGIPIECIQKRILHHPAPFARNPEDFKEIMARAETKWGVSPPSVAFLYAVEILGSRNEETMESKCRVFESFGWDPSQVEDLFRRKPTCFTLSEGNIKDTLCFFMNRLGYDPGYIIARSAVFNCSLEKRLVPRYHVFQLLKEKGLIRGDQAFYSVAKMTESRFLARYVQPFEKDVPDLLHIYTKSISSSTQLQNESRKNSSSSRIKLKRV